MGWVQPSMSRVRRDRRRDREMASLGDSDVQSSMEGTCLRVSSILRVL